MAPKNPPKVVKVKFLPPVEIQKKSSVPVKTSDPTQPATVNTSLPPAVAARIPKMSETTLQTHAQVKQVMSSPKTKTQPRRIQRVSPMTETIQPQAAQPIQTFPEHRNSRRNQSIRPSPSLATSTIKSAQPIQPVQVQRPDRRTGIRHQQTLTPTTLSQVPITSSQNPVSLMSSISERTAVQQRPAPQVLPSTYSAKSSPALQQVVKALTPSIQPRTRTAAYTQKPSSLTAGNTSEAQLSSIRGTFIGKVRQRVAEAKYYPGIARRRGMEGQPVVSFTLSKRGGLLKADLAKTSGYRLLDQAALEAVQQAAPYPEIPSELKTETYHFKLPISFVLK